MSTTTRLISQAVLAGLVAAAVLLGARGLAVQAQGDPPPPEPTATAAAAPQGGSSTPACDLVTAADAEAVLGAPTTELGDNLQCTRVATDLSGRAVSVARSPQLPSGDGALESATRQMAEAIGGEVRQVAAGEEAWALVSDMLAQVTVRTTSADSLVVVLTAPTGTPDQIVQQLTDLAGAAISRL